MTEMVTISFKIPKRWRRVLDRIAYESDQFLHLSDVIRQAIREYLKELRRNPELEKILIEEGIFI